MNIKWDNIRFSYYKDSWTLEQNVIQTLTRI